ncbi:MAG: nuclear transport factor 2 family protein [Micromonosporaceae bacterium]
MTENPANVVATYFDSWRTKDFERLRSVLAEDVTFAGPLGTANGADECQKGIEGLSRITTDIVVQKRFADGPDVLTWFDLHTSAAPPCPVANWSHVENGKITRIRVTFDPRPLVS